MRTDTPVTIERSDYTPYNWHLSKTSLHVELAPSDTRVTCRMSLERSAAGPLVLDGAGLTLEALLLDADALPASRYVIDGETLTIADLPDRCELEVITHIDPDANTSLEGLYRSSGNFCTQCEAQGFRKITWYPDRPDVLSVFDVSIEADEASCPILLANGNRVSQASLNNGRHTAHWHDPHPKPCYLFALVAGDLRCFEDAFTTAGGREVGLYIYVQAHNLDKCGYAMGALQRAMRWDEEVYGLEYDLDRFMIVAVDDFNMGAMENKGLNIFNSRYVLADERTATDGDFLGVESVIAHEYFHNWTGNRITCRDWFQLSLKEGLTVFRDQQFTADLHSRTVKRIEDVRLLRAAQFPEDSGPMAHPIRPDRYIEINNFYTVTVYEKGAEVIRMLHTLLGAERFRAAIDLYVQRHDGQAVTCEDFVVAVEDAGQVDLTRFRRWYEQAGTPVLTVSDDYDADARRYTLHVKQHCPATSGQAEKPPLHIPLRLGLLDRRSETSGESFALNIGRPEGDSTVVDVVEAEQSFIFEAVASRPVVSLLRGFSAPVRLRHEPGTDTLAFLMVHDTDTFNRWEAGQRLAQQLIDAILDGADVPLDSFVNACGAVLADTSLDPALKAEMLSLPSLKTLADSRELIDIAALDAARVAVQVALAEAHEPALSTLVSAPRAPGLAVLDASAISQRSLAAVALGLLGSLGPGHWQALAVARYERADNMTDRIMALGALCHRPGAERDAALADFYQTFRHERLVVDKWFSLQAMARHPKVIDEVVALTCHPDFEPDNPNRLRSLIAAFASGNPLHFHAVDGRGYELLADHVIRLDGRNPQLAARLINSLADWRRYRQPGSGLMRAALQRVAAIDGLSPDVFEIVARSLK